MKIGFQGEPFSYSDQASSELFPDNERVGYPSFVAAFDALRDAAVDRLVLPIENSTTGSVLPVLDRLLPGNVYVTGEHLVEIAPRCTVTGGGFPHPPRPEAHSHP